jgi:hypothetical protein
VLENRDSEHAVNEVLGSAPCLHPSRVRVLSCSSKYVLREDDWTTTRARCGIRSHTGGIGLRKTTRKPSHGC